MCSAGSGSVPARRCVRAASSLRGGIVDDVGAGRMWRIGGGTVAASRDSLLDPDGHRVHDRAGDRGFAHPCPRCRPTARGRSRTPTRCFGVNFGGSGANREDGFGGSGRTTIGRSTSAGRRLLDSRRRSVAGALLGGRRRREGGEREVEILRRAEAVLDRCRQRRGLGGAEQPA